MIEKKINMEKSFALTNLPRAGKNVKIIWSSKITIRSLQNLKDGICRFRYAPSLIINIRVCTMFYKKISEELESVFKTNSEETKPAHGLESKPLNLILDAEKDFVVKKIIENKIILYDKNIYSSKKILVMGLPGTGKTTLSQELKKYFPLVHLNADEIRNHFDDWDFSEEGRIRQAERMLRFSNYVILKNIFAITDFVCPLAKTRSILKPDILIWMDTEKKGRFKDTNKIFEPPRKFHFRIPTKKAKYWAKHIKDSILSNDY